MAVHDESGHELLGIQACLADLELDLNLLRERIERLPQLSSRISAEAENALTGTERTVATLREALLLLGSRRIAELLQVELAALTDPNRSRKAA